MITPNEALKTVLESIPPLGTENLPVFNALGRTVAGICISKRDIPLKDSSAMDGYAVRHEDAGEAHAKLKVLGVIAAGDDVSSLHVGKGESYRIMTGAHLPPGADTVVQREHTDDGTDSVTIRESGSKGNHVRPARDDVAKGAILNYSGSKLSPYMLSRFVSVGTFNMDFYRKPRVAVISTGSEIASPSDYDKPDKMIDANAPAVMAMIQEAGGEYSYIGVIPDEEASLVKALNSLKGFDMVVVSGGISAGDFDCMAHISGKVGLEWNFTKVSQKPGKPFSYGSMRGMPVFGLPGNPVSCMFCAYFYLVPAVRKMSGVSSPAQKPVAVVLGEDMKRSKGRIHFDRVRLDITNGIITAFPYRSQNSNLIDSMVASNGFAELSGDLEGVIPKGNTVNVYIFNSTELI